MFWYRSFISRMAFFILLFPTAGFQPQRSHWDGYMQPTKALCGHGCFCGFDMAIPPLLTAESDQSYLCKIIQVVQSYTISLLCAGQHSDYTISGELHSIRAIPYRTFQTGNR